MIRRRKRTEGFSLVELLIVVAIIGIIAAIAIPNLLNAIQRGKQKRSMADIRSVGEAIEIYQVDFNMVPDCGGGNISACVQYLEPVYIKKLPQNDGWNRPIKYVTESGGTPNEYTLWSYGKDGSASTCAGTAAQGSFDDDIAFSNGQFTCAPQGLQR